jgi:hypothetical protein
VAAEFENPFDSSLLATNSRLIVLALVALLCVVSCRNRGIDSLVAQLCVLVNLVAMFGLELAPWREGEVRRIVVLTGCHLAFSIL